MRACAHYTLICASTLSSVRERVKGRERGGRGGGRRKGRDTKVWVPAFGRAVVPVFKQCMYACVHVSVWVHAGCVGNRAGGKGDPKENRERPRS